MSNNDIKYRVGLSIIPQLVRFKSTQLDNYHSNLEYVWNSTSANSMIDVIPASETKPTLDKQPGTKPTHIDKIYHSNGLPKSSVSSNLVIL